MPGPSPTVRGIVFDIVMSQTRFRLQLKHLFYATALIASALSVFGTTFGWPIATLVLAFWYVELKFQYFSGRPLGWKWREVIAVLFIIGVLVGLLLPPVQGTRVPHREWTAWRLNNIVRFLEEYIAKHGALPPRVIVDDNGKPMHSWRALLLKDTEYRMEEPWNSEHNLDVASQFRLINGDDQGKTSVLAVYGPDTLWSPQHQATIRSHFKQSMDDVPYAIWLVVSDDHRANLCEPKDIHTDDFSELLIRPKHVNDMDWKDAYFARRYYGRYARAGSDLSVRFDRADLKLFRKLARVSTFDTAWEEYLRGVDDTAANGGPQRLDYVSVRYDNCLKFAVFVCLAIYPVRWQRQQNKSLTDASSESTGTRARSTEASCQSV